MTCVTAEPRVDPGPPAGASEVGAVPAAPEFVRAPPPRADGAG